MRFEFYGLVFDTPLLSVHLWSPWRATALEHRLFEAVVATCRVPIDKGPDEWRLRLTDSKSARAALQAVARVMKGWQEEADLAGERRGWRWLCEADTDADGYDHNGEPLTLWVFLRLALDRGGPGEPEKGEDIDLEGFGLRIWGEEAGPR